MSEFTIKMYPYNQRPVFPLYGMPALFDTGAIIPVTSLSVKFLKEHFGAEYVIKGSIRGIGGEVSGEVYSLKNFMIGDITYETLEVFHPDNVDPKFSFILSATLFYGYEYGINTTIGNKQTLTLRIPDEQSTKRVFHIKDLDNALYAQLDGKLLNEELT